MLSNYIIIEGLEKTEYLAQAKSNTRKKRYNIRITQKYNKELNDFEIEKECECQGFYFRKNCSHINELMNQLKEDNEL
jgi:hypothetical protein